jgi:hypothetical protein
MSVFVALEKLCRYFPWFISSKNWREGLIADKKAGD